MTDNPGSTDYIPVLALPSEEFDSLALRREFLENDIQNAIAGGFGVEETIRGYRTAGLKFTDSFVRDLYHTRKGELSLVQDELTSRYRFIPLDDIIPDQEREAITRFTMRQCYGTVVNLAVYDVQRNQVKTVDYLHYHNRRLTNEQVIGAALETFNEPSAGVGIYYFAMGGSIGDAYIDPNCQ
jgi:hypothetical protein